MNLKRIRIAIIVLLLFAMILVIPVGAAGLADSAWPQFGGDLNNTGLSSYVGAQDATQKWAFPTGTISYASPVIGSDGTIYVGSNSAFYAMDPNGTKKWSYPVMTDHTAALGSDGTIYVNPSSSGKFLALNPDGTLKWQTPIYGGKSSVSIGSDGTIFFINSTGYLHATNPDGTINWIIQVCPSPTGQYSPAIGPDGTIYAATGQTTSASVSAVNPDGTLKWKYYPANTVSGPTMIGPDNTIYFGSMDKNITALNFDGSVKWQYKNGADVFTFNGVGIGPDGTLYTGSFTKTNITALNPDGTVKWRYKAGGVVRGSPTIGADGTIYIGNNGDKKLYALNPDGSEKWTSSATGGKISSAPAIGPDGTIYIGSDKLYAFAGVVDYSSDKINGSAPLAVQFTGSSPLTVTAWNWDFGDGTTSTEQSPSHTYSSVGSYTVNLSITHANGVNYLRQVDYIRIYETPVAGFTASGTSGVYPLTVLFTDESTNSPTSWSWDFGDKDSTNATVQNPVHTYKSAGTYTVMLTIKNPAGTSSSTKTGYISVGDTPPVVSFTGTPRAGLESLTVQFNDTSTLSPTSWSWDFGDGKTSTEQNPTHTYSSVGSYTVSHTATNTIGPNTTSSTGYATVLAQQPLSNYHFNNIYVANDDGVKYDVQNGAAASGGTYTYVPNTYWIMFRQAGGGLNPIHISSTRNQWSSADITTTTNQSGSFWITFSGGQTTMPNAILMLAVNGTIPDDFKVHIRSSGHDFDVGTPGTFNQYQSGPPSVSTFLDGAVDQTFNKSDFFYGPQSWKPCSSSDYPIYTEEDQSDPINQFQLMFVDLRVGAIQNASLPQNGMIKVEYEFTNLTSTAVFNSYGWYMQCNHGTGMIMTNDVTKSGFTVLPVTAPPVAGFTADTTNGYVNAPIRFTDTSTNSAQSWAWDFNNDGTVDSTEQSPSHAYTAAGKYTVTLAATNNKGSDTETKADYITVTMPSAPPVAAFTADTTSGAIPLAVKFTDTSGTGTYQWLWDFGDGSTSTSQNPSHTYTVAGDYTVNLTATNAAGPDKLSMPAYITAIVSPKPAAAFTASPVNGVASLTVSFTDASTNNPKAWSWDFGDNTTSTYQNPVHTYGSAGLYPVTLTVTNDKGSGQKTISSLVYVTTAKGPLSGYNNVNIRMANHDGIRWDTNDDGTYDVPSGSAGGGLNVLHISTDPADTSGQVTTTNAKSGTFYVTGANQDDIVLLLAVNGTIPDNFAARIKTSGYTWIPPYVAGTYTYQSTALDQTFTKADLFYGPQSWKPTQGNANYPLFKGEDTSSSVNQYQLMFIDTRAGLIAKDSSLKNYGAVRVDYTFSNLPDNAHFNVYGWKSTNGMGWTNDVNTSGYSVIPLVLPPVADFTANQVEGMAPFNPRFKDTSLNTPTGWAWDFGDGNTSTKQSPDYTYTTAGTYTVKLTATNSKGTDTKTRSSYIIVTAPKETTNAFTLTGVNATTTGSTQTIAVNATNSTVTGNVVTVTNISSTWDHMKVTLTEAPDTVDGNLTGTVQSVEAIAANISVPIESLGKPNVTLSLTMSQVPNSTAAITSTISSDPDSSIWDSFTLAATSEKKEIVATAYTVNFTKTDIANSGTGGIIQSANVTMAVNHTWVQDNGGTSRIAVMHRSDEGTVTFLATEWTGLCAADGNDYFTAVSPTGLSTFVLTAYSPVTTAPSSGSSSSWSYYGGSDSYTYYPPPTAIPAVTATATATPTPTATPVATETTKQKVRITPWPTGEVQPAPQEEFIMPAVSNTTGPGMKVLWKNPLFLAAEIIAAIAILTVVTAGYLKKRRRDRDPLRWEYK